jgi:beta-galactosidase GanA
MALNRRTFNTLALGTAAAASPFAAPAHAGTETGSDLSSAIELGTPHTVTFDKYSLLIDGVRTPVWSGEVHPFRLPSPSLWLDVLQKLRANGYNTISIYVAWNYHSPNPGSYDFTGVRDLGLFLRTAAEAGLFVTVRPGPYINAEVDAGGFPGWLTVSPGTARTNNATYLGHVDEWYTAVNAVVAPYQYTTGGGTVVLYQLENEYASHVSDSTGQGYMAHLYAKARADGITVPLFHNDKGRNGYWIPGGFPTGGESGRYLYAFDGYPSPGSTPPDWGYFGAGGAKGGATASPNTPGFMAEFGGGWFDPWGGAEFAGLGYAQARATRDAVYERRFYLTNLANGIKVHNVYMTFGGTSWGWLPAPVVYTSYDYGAAVDEARNQTSKLVPMKQLGLMLETVPDLGRLDAAAAVAASDNRIKVYHLTNPDTQAHVYVLRNDTGSAISVTLPVTTASGTVTVPAAGSPIRLPGKDAKLLATGIRTGHRTLIYSTAQPMLQTTVNRTEIAVLTGRTGDPVEAVIAAAAAPAVTVLSGAATTAYDATAGALRVNATLGGRTALLIDDRDGTAPLVLILADDAATATLWRPLTAASGPAFVRGPLLVRDATVDGDTLLLTGDTDSATDLEVWAPYGISRVRWNGAHVHVDPTASGSLLGRTRLPGPQPVALPAITAWYQAAENPESDPAFDDGGWTPAAKSASGSTTAVPTGQPVLFADDYGFHYGDVWYRGRFTGAAAAVTLSYSSGTQGMLMAWLDGVPLGSHRQPVPTQAQDTISTWTATASFAVPADLQADGAHVLSILVRPMAHSEDGGANDAHKAARGLTAVTATGTAAAAAPSISWLIQGGSTTADPVRGPLNTGGLYGERTGWHLPGLREDKDEQTWSPVAFPITSTKQGVDWYRAHFDLDLPNDQDTSIGLTLTDDATRAYRVQLFLNGWNLGQYINDVGPQHTFVLPNGILDPNGHNVLALAVLRDGTTASGPGSATLTLLGNVAGGVAVTSVNP